MKKRLMLLVVALSVGLTLGSTATVALYDVAVIPGIVGVTPRPGGIMEIDVAPTMTPRGPVAVVDASFLPHIEAHRRAGGLTATFDILAPGFSTTEVGIPVAILRAMAGMAANIQTPVGGVEVPAGIVSSLAAANRPLSVTLSSPTVAAIDAARPPGTTRIGSPVGVHIGFEGNVSVTIPHVIGLPTDPAARAAFLASLRVFGLVDGAGVPITALSFTIDEAARPPVLRGVTFTTNRSGQFAVIR